MLCYSRLFDTQSRLTSQWAPVVPSRPVSVSRPLKRSVVPLVRRVWRLESWGPGDGSSLGFTTVSDPPCNRSISPQSPANLRDPPFLQSLRPRLTVPSLLTAGPTGSACDWYEPPKGPVVQAPGARHKELEETRGTEIGCAQGSRNTVRVPVLVRPSFLDGV